MAVCAACGQEAGDSQFCVSCGSSRAGGPTRSAPVDRRWIVGVVTAVILGLVAAVVLVVVNRGPTVAGSIATPTLSVTDPNAMAADQSSDDPDPPASVVTIGSGTSRSSASSGAAGQPQSVTAIARSSTSTADDSVDDEGIPVSFGPAKAVDGDPATAWRAAAGNGIGVELVLQLPAKCALTSVGLVPGYNKVDATTGKDRFRQNRRISRVAWTFADGSSVIQDFKDDRTLQTMPVSTTTSSVRIKIVSSVPPEDVLDPRNFVAISEVSFQGVLG